MTDQEHGRAVPVGEFRKRGQGAAHAGIVAALDARIGKGHDRIDLHQAGARPRQGILENSRVLGQSQRFACRGILRTQDEDARQIGTQRLQARADGVLGAVLAAKDESGGTSGSGCAVRKRASFAKARAEVERHQGFAQAGIAVEHGQLAQGQTARPQPGDGS
jgi:hypothetical protein